MLLGKRGNYRAVEMAERGLRERVAPRLLAIGKSFDHGAFKIIEEPLDALACTSRTSRSRGRPAGRPGRT